MARVKSPPPASLFAWAGVAAPEPTPVVTLVADPVVATDEDVEAFAIIEPETVPEPEVIAVVVSFPELPTTLADHREGTTVAVVKDIRGEWWIHRHRGDASMSQQLWTREELTSLRDRIVAWALAEGV